MTGEPTPTPRAPSRADAWIVLAVALAARLAVVAWAWARFPPAADGAFYQRIAERIAQGLGYTWLWPDGVVTFAAHYPVGYPAAIGAVYALTGPRPGAAMALNAVIGALAAFAAHRLAARAASRRGALIAGLLVALHPGLVAYTPALMTEGITASLITVAAAIAAAVGDFQRRGAEAQRRRGEGSKVAASSASDLCVSASLRLCVEIRGPLAIGLVSGAATLVRPQSIVLAPIFALLAVEGWKLRLRAAVVAALCALLVCAPWTARNCVRMKSCALVSVNGGWNLLIGADAESTGAWSPIKVPERCREVYDEAEKDQCFGREARGYIASHPVMWIELVPKKLAATFDYAGAAGWYLHESNGEAFTERHKIALGAVETLFERVILALALFAVARPPREPEPRRLRIGRFSAAAIGVIFAFTLHAWVGYVAFAVAAALRGRALLRGPLLYPAAAAAVGATVVTHAVFFGAGRYSLVVFPLLTALAPLAFQASRADHTPRL